MDNYRDPDITALVEKAKSIGSVGQATALLMFLGRISILRPNERSSRVLIDMLARSIYEA